MPVRSGFRKGSPIQQILAGVLLLLASAIVVVAERDIQRRGPGQIRGSRPLWRVASLNALGALAYLRWGRLGRSEK